MTLLHNLFTIIVIILLLIGAALLGFRLAVSPRAVQNHPALVEFQHFSPPQTPNFYLSCPKDYCPGSDKAALSPTYHLSVEALKTTFNQLIAQQPRLYKLAQSSDGLHVQYVQLSALWHFPDFIDVRFIALDKTRSTLAIFSRARFGYSDFGVNKQRVTHWLALLGHRLPLAEPRFD